MELVHLLEPQWTTLSKGDLVDVQAELVVFDQDQSKHLCKSLINHRFFVVQGILSKGAWVSILGATVVEGAVRPTLTVKDAYVLIHQVPGNEIYETIIDTCAGMSLMTQGPVSNGARVKVSNELRPKFCEILKASGHSEVICGDIGDRAVVSAIHQAWSSSSLLMAGFSCQPWSRLGDRAGFQDQRASSLPSTLKAAYFLRCHTIVLECVTAAGDDVEVKKTVQAFMKATGYRMGSTKMKLENIMPANRHRWWCILTCPFFPPIQLRDLLVRSTKATIGSMLPFLPNWPQEEVQQLLLDRYESNKFWQSGTFDRCLMMENGILPTALHGWGNQLTKCPCECRQFPMSDDRLMTRGIFSSLVLVGGHFESSSNSLPKTRHIHPWELCTLNGVIYDESWSSDMCLLLAGLGQMATPIQSAWVYGQYKSQWQAFWNEKVETPESFLWNHFCRLFRNVAAQQPDIGHHPQFLKFAEETKVLLKIQEIATQVQTPVVTAHEAGAVPPRVPNASEDVPQSFEAGVGVLPFTHRTSVSLGPETSSASEAGSTNASEAGPITLHPPEDTFRSHSHHVGEAGEVLTQASVEAGRSVTITQASEAGSSRSRIGDDHHTAVSSLECIRTALAHEAGVGQSTGTIRHEIEDTPCLSADFQVGFPNQVIHASERMLEDEEAPLVFPEHFSRHMHAHRSDRDADLDAHDHTYEESHEPIAVSQDQGPDHRSFASMLTAISTPQTRRIEQPRSEEPTHPDETPFPTESNDSWPHASLQLPAGEPEAPRTQAVFDNRGVPRLCVPRCHSESD
eukprot:Skav211882  [mRNA]  locus=scaffold3296:3551:6014:+ [translate_table: standard]